MRAFFGVKGGDFFCFVEKLHCAIQPDVHIDSVVGVGAMGRFLGNLKDDPIKSNGIIVGHGTLFFKSTTPDRAVLS
jgi:hypothetical protein